MQVDTEAPGGYTAKQSFEFFAPRSTQSLVLRVIPRPIPIVSQSSVSGRFGQPNKRIEQTPEGRLAWRAWSAADAYHVSQKLRTGES